ncbi:MAG: ATP-binding protein, partial [Anaerolineales bacterium]|nr:ATP-binding protein [Anaerolineales bacterium]
QMKQVLLNLVHNALQAMPEGGRMEIATAERQKIGREGVIVSVSDTGVGIPPEDQTRIFEPFFTTKADHGGTGLGLSVTYGIVSDHNGEIELVSQPGLGSTFTVWLPKA